MEIEMEMDAPLPDELEWLENANIQFDEPPEADLPDDDELLELCGASPVDDPHSRKRNRGEEGKGSDDVPVVEKKSRKCGEEEEEAGDLEKEDDWLRYSPKWEEEGEVNVGERIVSRFASEIDGDCMAVTGPDGELVYAKMGSGFGRVDVSRRMDKPDKGLLLEPIEVLMERLEEQDIQKAMQENSGPPSCSSDSSSAMVNEHLWVEKYAPSSFLELLSDEQTNREVLLWLKQWDPFVFGSQIRSTTEDVLSALRRHSSSVQHKKSSDGWFSKGKTNTFNNKSFEKSKNLENGRDFSKGIIEFGRKTSSNHPEQKVLLLSGPPGLGKTTLAHVAAKHCGYHVVEINASDERSSSAIESKILDVVQMNSVMASSKPKCLVIDEIDGALGEGKGAIEVILKMITADKKFDGENDYPNSSSGKIQNRRRRRSATLSRPVICICNELYSPALRPLRQVAKVHKFEHPTISRVVNRLKYICGKEGFRTSSVALAALAECTECDIRSCLNTLQFLNKNKESLNILDIDSQVVGRKDMSRTAYDVWKEVLQQRKQKRGKPRNLSSSSGDFDFLCNLIYNRGEYELIVDGIYENLLQLGYHDPAMHKTVGCLDVLGFSDSLNRFIMRTQQMALSAYQPFIAIRVKNLVAQVGRPQIEWPKSLQRCRATLMENNDLFKCWHNKLAPSISRHLSMGSFVQDIVSPLLHILAPPSLRPVALHLLSEREKDDFSQLVDIMVSYSITYKHSKAEMVPMTQKYGAGSDADLLILDPPIGSFVKFKDHRIQYSGLSSSVKQVLVHEVEKHKILCDGHRRGLDIHNESNEDQISSRKSTSKSSIATVDSVTTSNRMNGMQEKPTPGFDRMSAALGTKLKAPVTSAKTARHSSSFFDRFRKRSNDDENRGCTSPKPATIERDQRPFLFKYNEGFTNAIKRPVRMRELLQ